MSLTTARGAPYPVAADANDYPGYIHALATWVNDRPGIATLTTTQRNALDGGELWAGRHIWNSTTSRLEYYDGTKWGAVPSPGRILAQTVIAVNAGGASSNVTDADVDAAHYAVTFTVPDSGAVWVEVDSFTTAHAGTVGLGATLSYWTLRNGTTVVATSQILQALNAVDVAQRIQAAFYLSGLTPGASLTYKLGHHVGGTNTGPAVSTSASAIAPASMRVLEA